MAKDKLQWVTISSEQVILMSICLQSMIDELLLKNVNINKKKEIPGKSWVYLTRNGRSQVVTGASEICLKSLHVINISYFNKKILKMKQDFLKIFDT